MNFSENIKRIFTKKTLKKYRYWIFILSALLILGLSLRGCTNSKSKKKNFYSIARENIFQVELLGRERNVTAFTSDLMASIASDHGIRFQWLETNPSHLLDGLENGEYDFILTAVRPNIVNQEHYDFSEPIFDLGPVLIVREGSSFTSLKEMQKLPIGIPYGLSTNFNALRTPGVNVYDMSFVYYNNMNRALDDLTSNQIDGVIMKAIAAYAITQGLYAGKLKIVTPPFNDEGLRIVALKNNSLDQIITDINESINTMRQNGSYETMIKKWSLVNPQAHYWHPESKKE